MTEILNDLSSPSLAVATKDNLYAFFAMISDATTASGENGTYGFRWHTSVSHPWFNGVLVNRPPSAGVAHIIRDTVAYFRSRDIDAFTWWLAPSLKPDAWSRQLFPYGFQYDDHTPGMAIDLAALPPLGQPKATVHVVEDRENLAVWVRTFIRGFEMPDHMAEPFLALLERAGMELPLRHYLGFVNGEPLTTSTLFLGAGVAGIYNVATLPAARGRGLGSTMTLNPLFEARDLGYRAGILQSSSMGYDVYRRLGFQHLCRIDHFSWRVR